MTRPSWDEVWSSVAVVIASRSLCSLAQVGAVIVSDDNRVVMTGYNGPPAGFNYGTPCVNWCPRAHANLSGEDLPIRSPDYSRCESIHAEANALIRADHTQLQGGTIFVSSSVCVNCARMIMNSGISRVVHSVSERDAHRRPEAVEAYMQSGGIIVERHHNGGNL